MSGQPFEKAAAEKDELRTALTPMELYKIMIGYCIFYPKMFIPMPGIREVINMVREIMLYTSNDLRDFMHHLVCASIGYWSTYKWIIRIVDGKSVLGLMAIDYKTSSR